MDVLLVYELVPQETIHALIPDVDPETMIKLQTIHGTVVNGDELTDEQHAIHDEIQAHLADDPEYGDRIWKTHKQVVVKGQPIKLRENTTYVWAGFML